MTNRDTQINYSSLAYEISLQEINLIRPRCETLQGH